MKTPEIGDIVEVKFFDIEDDNSWISLKKAENAKPILCKSTGYLLKETDKYITIISVVSEDAGCGYRLTIPRGVIAEPIRLVEEAEIDDFPEGED